MTTARPLVRQPTAISAGELSVGTPAFLNCRPSRLTHNGLVEIASGGVRWSLPSSPLRRPARPGREGATGTSAALRRHLLESRTDDVVVRARHRTRAASGDESAKRGPRAIRRPSRCPAFERPLPVPPGAHGPEDREARPQDGEHPDRGVAAEQRHGAEPADSEGHEQQAEAGVGEEARKAPAQ